MGMLRLLFSFSEPELVLRTATPHSIRTTIQHWQLRDVINFPSPPSPNSSATSYAANYSSQSLYVISQASVQHYNRKTRKSDLVLQDLAFSPTSMAVACGYLAVGGTRSQVVVRRLEDPSW